MYWWDRAAQLVRSGTISQFGLITTNSITQTFNRRVVAGHLRGSARPVCLTFAIPDHPWVDSVDAAAVRIAMTVGSCNQTNGNLLSVLAESPGSEDESNVAFRAQIGDIFEDLRIGADIASAQRLIQNTGICGQGMKLVGDFFVPESGVVTFTDEGGPGNVIRRLVAPSDVLNHGDGRLVIDFFGLSEEEAREMDAAAFQHVLDYVKPLRDTNKRDSIRKLWWRYAWERPVIREALQGLSRYFVTLETAKHRVFSAVPPNALWDGSLFAFALDDWYHAGVLSSSAHCKWALSAGGKLGPTPRYNAYRCFETFPFPAATDAQRQTIRELGEALDAHRKKQQAAHPGLTITGMYNVLEKLRTGEELTAKEKKIHDDGLVSVLKKIHDDLDAAVFDAYGWPATLSDDEILERLVALNHERATEEKRGLIRWLRPEFQSKFQEKAGSGDVQQEIDVADDDDEAPGEPAEKKPRRGRGASKKSRQPVAEKPRNVVKHPWPKDLAEQTRAVRAALAASGGIVTAADLARHFTNAKAPRVEEILDTLVALGHARRTDSGYAPA
jgi:hypothetical protein